MSLSFLASQFSKVVGDPVGGRVADAGFRSEEFVIPRSGSGGWAPSREMLTRLFDRDGGLISSEEFFNAVHAAGSQVLVDMFLIEHALNKASEDQLFPVTINVDLMSALDERFVSRASTLAHEFDISRQDGLVTLEITERSDLDAEQSLAALAALRGVGYYLAADDVNIFSQRDMDRLALLAPYLDMIKIDHKVLHQWRGDDAAVVAGEVRRVKNMYPGKLIVVEGATAQDHERGVIDLLGVDGVQNYTPPGFVLPHVA